jgi:hypothetical protein
MRVPSLCGIVGLACTLGVQSSYAQQPPKPQISEATREKAAETNANADALVLQDFHKRIDGYLAIHKAAKKESLPLKETANPAEIKAAQQTLAAVIRAGRADAKAGDIFTPEIRNKFRRLMYPELAGREGRETKEKLKEDVHERDEAPAKPVRMTVNATYPEGNPLPTTPTNLLVRLPTLPKELEYRIIDKTLILRDVEANTIVDFIPNAIQ